MRSSPRYTKAWSVRGRKEGILFLDEINCVSETLTPAILQFLQYKVFGRHAVPEGWVVVTAGNPSEFNRSTHDFDVATWDRLKRIDVDPDYSAWKAYALATRVHPAITSYLDVEKDDFYHIETTLDGKQFVTARGWDDLRVMQVYERRGIPLPSGRRPVRARPRTSNASRCITTCSRSTERTITWTPILAGEAPGAVFGKGQRPPLFDERLALVGLLVSAISAQLHQVMLLDSSVAAAYEELRDISRCCDAGEQDESDVRALAAQPPCV